jgi:hypothetical protein
MKIHKLLLYILAIFLLLPGLAKAQMPSVEIHEVISAPGTDIPVQVDMKNFTGSTYGNVSAVTLTIDFDQTLLDYKGLITNTVLYPGTYSANVGTPGKLKISYMAPSTGPITFFNINGKFLDLKFDYTGGFASDLTFNMFDEGCQVANKYLNPIADVAFVTGNVSQTASEVTLTAGSVSAAVGAQVNIPVNISAYSGDISELSMQMSYDETMLTFVSLTSTVLSGYSLDAGTPGIITLNWSGSSAAPATLFTLRFDYLGGGDAAITFDHGCMVYASDLYLNTTALPTSFVNGSVTFLGAKLTIGSMSQGVGASVNLPVAAQDFGAASIGDIILNVGYNSSKLIYDSHTAAQLTGWTINSVVPGLLGLKRTGAAAVIADGTLLTISFSPAGGAGGVTPVTFNSGTQILTPALSSVGVDFVNGSITQASPSMMATIGSVTGCDASFALPVTLADIPVNVASFTFVVNYNAGALAFTALSGVSASLTDHGTLTPSFDGTNLFINWERTPGYMGAITLSGIVFNMNFTHLIGSSTVVFNMLSVISDLNLVNLPVTFTDGALTCNATDLTLNLNVLLEGLFDGGTTMRPAYDENGLHFAAGIADEITLELHNASAYGTVEYSASNVMLAVDGSAVLSIPMAFNGSYFITIRHRNSIETTTASPVSFAGGTVNYDFTTGADKAFGDNLKLVDGKAVIFGGDVVQDGSVDLSDASNVDNEAAMASSGYLTEDVNGDGTVDLSDASIIDNNASMAIGAILP